MAKGEKITPGGIAESAFGLARHGLKHPIDHADVEVQPSATSQQTTFSQMQRPVD
jgi:hypothetical protein